MEPWPLLLTAGLTTYIKVSAGRHYRNLMISPVKITEPQPAPQQYLTGFTSVLLHSEHPLQAKTRNASRNEKTSCSSSKEDCSTTDEAQNHLPLFPVLDNTKNMEEKYKIKILLHAIPNVSPSRRTYKAVTLREVPTGKTMKYLSQ